MLGSQARMLLREPLERHFGLPASPGRVLDGAESLSVLCPHGVFELRPVRSQQAAEPPDRNPEIVECLAVETIVEPALCSPGGRQALERQPSRSFLIAPKEEIVRQRAATSGLGARERCLRRALLLLILV